jgi:hypothetical protein
MYVSQVDPSTEVFQLKFSTHLLSTGPTHCFQGTMVQFVTFKMSGPGFSKTGAPDT